VARRRSFGSVGICLLRLGPTLGCPRREGECFGHRGDWQLTPNSFSFGELDVLFGNKVAARKFTKVKVKDMPIARDQVETYEHDEVDDKYKEESKHVETASS
jgi:hypothetical protein